MPTEPDQGPTNPERPAARRLGRSARSPKAKPSKPRAPSPTRVIQTGEMHTRIAAAILRGAQQRVPNLDVGEIPEPKFDPTSDPDRAVTLTAHAVARVMDRIPFSRKISRHFEGTENRAGILSDIAAILTELARRNPEIVKERLHGFGQDLQNARNERAQAKEQSQPTGVNTP